MSGIDCAPVTVSLTAIPSRLHALDIVIKSLLAQDLPPERILVWLHREMAGSVPNRVRRLVGDQFQIRFVELASSHKKLIYTLDAHPDAVVVTCDDDMIYPADWLGRLWADHLKHPDDIIANDVRKIRFAADGTPLPYDQWRRGDDPRSTAPEFFSVGYAGVLYPPGSLHPDVTDAETFLALTPKADDLWFKAMSHLGGTSVRRASAPSAPPIPIPFTQGKSLKRTNVREDQNREQWMALARHYEIRFDSGSDDSITLR